MPNQRKHIWDFGYRCLFLILSVLKSLQHVKQPSWGLFPFLIRLSCYSCYFGSSHLRRIVFPCYTNCVPLFTNTMWANLRYGNVCCNRTDCVPTPCHLCHFSCVRQAPTLRLSLFQLSLWNVFPPETLMNFIFFRSLLTNCLHSFSFSQQPV